MAHETYRRIAQAQIGGRVKRYHICSTLSEQSNAAHSWGVAVLADLIWPDCSRSFLRVCLHHDLAEGKYGDLPGRAAPGAQEATDLAHAEFNQFHGFSCEHDLSRDEWLMLRFLDRLELLFFCAHEMRLGNRTMAHVFDRGAENCRDTLRKLAQEHEHVDLVCAKYILGAVSNENVS